MMLFAGNSPTEPVALPQVSPDGADANQIADAFSSPNVTLDSGGSLFLSLPDGTAEHAPLTGLEPNTAYQVTGEVLVYQQDAALQIAIIDSVTVIGSTNINSTVFPPFSFMNNATTDDLKMRLLSNGKQLSFSKLDIKKL